MRQVASGAARLPAQRRTRRFDFVIINALFETALFDLKTVVHSQRLKFAAQLRNRSQVFAALGLA